MAIKKKNKPDKEEILREIADSLKKKEEQEEEKEPEKESEEDIEEIDFSEFTPRLKEISSRSPVLEKIAGGQTVRPIFVGGIPQQSLTTNENRDGDNFKYVPGTESENESKYLGPQEEIIEFGERINILEVGRRQESLPHIDQETLVKRASETTNFNNSQSIERVKRPQRFDVESAGRRNPMIREEKYEKYNPKLPKSR